jgi:hypothetical protein
VVLTATLAACSSSPVGPLQISVLYLNVRSHVGNEQPGTAVITWVSPRTATVDSSAGPYGISPWYEGFRTDTVYPGEDACVRFTAPTAEVAVQLADSFPDGAQEVSRPGYPTVAVWSAATAWAFTGDQILPAGDSTFWGVIPGC